MGEEIPQISRIITIAETYERVYRREVSVYFFSTNFVLSSQLSI
ncbi:hypothetical protein [Dehalobacterium formicoaceticum]